MRSIIVVLSFCVVTSWASSYDLHKYTERQADQRRLIVDSPETSISKYPSATMILDFNDIVNSFFLHCGGVIVNRRSVLTAAACVNDYVPVETWRIRIGSSYIFSGGVMHTAGKIILHPDFNSCTLHNDIALLRSSTAFDYNHNVNKAPISGKNYIVPDGDQVWAVGWAADSQMNPPWNSTQKLRETPTITVDIDTCHEFYNSGPRLNISQSMICIGLLRLSGRRPCINNNGSPVYHNGVLVGIRVWDWVVHDCSVNIPEVNMKVSSYVDWINDNI